MPDVTPEGFRAARDAVAQRQAAYQLAFLGPGVAAVLDDLRKFCRAEATTFHPDPRVHAVLEGRREVWLRIQEHLNLDAEALVERYSGGTIRVIKVTEEDEDA